MVVDRAVGMVELATDYQLMELATAFLSVLFLVAPGSPAAFDKGKVGLPFLCPGCPAVSM